MVPVNHIWTVFNRENGKPRRIREFKPPAIQWDKVNNDYRDFLIDIPIEDMTEPPVLQHLSKAELLIAVENPEILNLRQYKNNTQVVERYI